MSKETKTNAMRFLESHRVPYRMKTYDCDAFVDGVTTAALAGQPPEQTFKTLVTRGKSGAHYVFVLPAEGELDLKKAALAVREKSVELLPTKELLPVTGYVRGGCTPVGMKRRFPTVFHRSALEHEAIFLSGGRVGTQIEVDPRAVAEVIEAVFEDLLLAPEAAL